MVILRSFFVIAIVITLLYFIQKYFIRGEMRLTLFLILGLTLFLKCVCASDLYLHEWDERYHALVAKNMVDDPLKPSLYKTPLHDYHFEDWTNDHIWLSKPPIGLFVVSCSVRLFGNHEYAVRAPAVLASLLAVYIVFLIFKKIYNDKIALLSAFFVGVHGVLTDLASGRLSSDAIETLFLLSVFLGIYYIIYNDDNNEKYATHLKVGLVTGISFLIKWQPALLILLLYGFDQLSGVNFRIAYKRILVALVCAALLPALWISFALHSYPQEMSWMLKAIFNPLYATVENNDSKWYSQLMNFGVFFGFTSYVVLLFYLLKRKVVFNQRRVFMLIWIILPLVIFSVAEIKRGTYLMITAPAIIALTAAMFYEEWHWSKLNLAGATALISFISIGVLSVEKLYLFSPDKSHTRDWSTEIKNRTLAPGSVLYNEPHYIELMFYHDVIAYPKSREWYEHSFHMQQE
jgi:4-amino-4-deoxy-L-arabinose transferase-like glycosyltransferase